MLKIGMVGVGGISGAHIPAWEAMEETSLTAVCDIRSENAAKCPGKRFYTDFDEMLEKEELDILDICLPTFLHAEFAIKAMERGIHVLCEKPLSLEAADVDRVYDAAARNHVKFMAAQVLRFWPEYELVKELYDSGKYGRLLSGSMFRLNSIPKWSGGNWMRDEKKSGLVPFDLHIHDLDFLVYAFGAPQKTLPHRSKRPEQDFLSVVYEYPDFFINTEASWYAAPYPFEASYRFQFEKAVIAYEKGICTLYEDGGSVTDLTNGAQNDTGSIHLPKSNAYANEIRYFTECVQNDRFPDKIRPEELKTVIGILHNL